jgi:hypothetical protein
MIHMGAKMIVFINIKSHNLRFQDGRKSQKTQIALSVCKVLLAANKWRMVHGNHNIGTYTTWLTYKIEVNASLRADAETVASR